ncbi:MAG: cob(I)yrinic acid a,c-diamide adenosyltransferase [Lentimicrobiaceae bacterium]|nr:cob(I)yrinic acid a,c-diamide adenosyltransferase [Lentimicrobiaceae bacterium]MCB9024430.1 cob(I)yrinic acid a,c-diamide adenosyltransferase [Lentimicrobiaceae bacterium]MCO5265623.1 cob(I)yrinic acid a,c-diamide adenosyltransferase [Lentimicrobium sp.]HPG33060.1 cob(I)yrinic acid a,c-diamide adenosyltransferase [Lentimicrobium sp.]
MSAEWKIYTKTGDKGETSLIGGTRVPKYHERIEAYGTLDELNSYLGFLRDHPIDLNSRQVLLEIQDRIFTAESLLAADPAKEIKSLPALDEDDIKLLEEEIDMMNQQLPPLTTFILPGGQQAASLCHISRCICRRAERLTIKLVENNPETLQGELVIKYLNRLSDYLFVLARKLTYHNNGTETAWIPRV